jgi:hypothetical protein
MNDHAPIHDPNLQRLVQNFDALADLVQTLIDRDRRRVPHEAVPVHEMEYTTEWQMEPTVEAAHSF